MFRDRHEAGRMLASALAGYRALSPLVMGLPRGGMPVAAEVARELGADLDVLVVRKLGAPHNPEFGFGAVGEGGTVVADSDVMHQVGVDDAALERMVSAANTDIARRASAFRGDRSMHTVRGRTVIIVDDGLATGSTAAAGIAVLRGRGARRIVLAVPVGSREAVSRLRRLADEVVCLERPDWFRAVGEHYADFEQISDAEVVRLLQESRPHARTAPNGGGAANGSAIDREVRIGLNGDPGMPGRLVVPARAAGIVLFAHGSGSSRHSPRNASVAAHLNAAGIGTLLFDLLTEGEAEDRANVFDIGLLASRLTMASAWTARQPVAAHLPIGYFGASTGAAAALVAAAEHPVGVRAVVSRGGRPDLAGDLLPMVKAPTLLIVGSRDAEVLGMNKRARARMHCPTALAVIPGASHLFEEPGTLDAVAGRATDWFLEHMAPKLVAA